MADKVQINQTGVIAVHTLLAKNQVDRAGVAVVCTQQQYPDIHIVQAGVVVVYSDRATEGKNQVDAVGVVVVYQDHRDALRKFPVLSPKTRWQTQAGKRVFPVVA